MQQDGSKCFARRPPTTPHDPRGGVLHLPFSEHGHVAYKIKGNHECSSMVAKYFGRRLRHPPLTIGMWSIGQNFRTRSNCISN